MTLGKTLGDPAIVKLSFDANRNPPILRSFDRYGHRIDEIEFHPAWHALLSIAPGAAELLLGELATLPPPINGYGALSTDRSIISPIKAEPAVGA